MKKIQKTRTLEVGMFIEVPAWKVFGRVTRMRPPMFGTEAAVDVLLQTDPEVHNEARMKWYRLEPTEYKICD